MEESHKPSFFGIRTRPRMLTASGIALMILGGMMIGLGWYQTVEVGFIHGIRGIFQGATFVMLGLGSIEAVGIHRGTGSKRMRITYSVLAVLLFLITLYIQFWLDH